jgi:hypothetical protein
VAPDRSWKMRALRLPLAASAGLAALLLAPIPAGAPMELAGWLGGPAVPLDKIAHFVLFLAVAWPWYRALSDLGVRRPGLAVIAGGTTYAAQLELLQAAITATRSAEWGDILAGALGAVASVSGALWLERRRVAVAEPAVRRSEPSRLPHPRPPA